jgi:hypothetical protein
MATYAERVYDGTATDTEIKSGKIMPDGGLSYAFGIMGKIDFN